jgi:hypothetical protein
MRMLLKAQMDVEAGNQAIHDGRMAEMMEEAMARLQPEAAYFGPLDGKRTALMVFDLKNPSDIPMVAEPFFANAKATVEMIPVMNRDDLQAGLAQITAATTTTSTAD